jgi:hypothetical protein
LTEMVRKHCECDLYHFQHHNPCRCYECR